MNIFAQKISEKFPGAVLGAHSDAGDDTVIVDSKFILDVMKFLKNDSTCRFDLLLDLCGVDYLDTKQNHHIQGRFEVVYHLYSLPKKMRVRIRTPLPAENPKVASVYSVWEAADWFEREAYDLVGIQFEGHPNLKRLMMWNEFEGHPLRKDYPIERRQPLPENLEIV